MDSTPPGPTGRGSDVSPKRIRCSHCHHASDVALIWAAADCCPHCLEPLATEPHRLGATPRKRFYETPPRSSLFAAPDRAPQAPVAH